PRASGKVREMLTARAKDIEYGVRRTAFRVLALRFAEALRQLCVEWRDARSCTARERAAEGFAWLGATPEIDPERNLGLLQGDPDPRVRIAADRSLRQRRQRVWAADYLDRVTAVSSTRNDDILGVW